MSILKIKMKKEDKKFAEEMCVCRNCPSFKECKEKIAYCVIGKSKCIKERNGCICGGCPVHAKLNLSSGYYCFSGKEA